MIVNHSSLYKALQKATKATGVTAVPPTEYLQLTVTKNKLHIAGCNFKFYIRVDVDIQDGVLNSFLVHAKKFLDYLSGLPDQALTITADKNLLVKYAGGKFNMPILSDDNFPVPAMPKTKDTMQISSDIFNEGLHRVSWAREKERPDRPSLECLRIGLQPGKITFVGASAGAMSVYHLEADHNITGELLIPDYCLPAFDFEPEKQLGIITDGNRLSVSYDNLLINATLLDEKYPDISGHVGLEGDKTASIDRGLLIGSLERIRKFAGGENKTVKLTFDKGLNLYAQSISGDEEVDETIDCEYTGEPFEVRTNANILLFAVKSLSEVHLTLIDEFRGRPGEEFIYRPILARESADSDNIIVISPVAY